MKYLKGFNDVEKFQIYLDDLRTPVDFENWIIVRNYDNFVEKIVEIGLDSISRISLDHDLADFRIEDGEEVEKTGYDAAKFLVDYFLDNYFESFPMVTVHSDNNVGSLNIVTYVNNFLKWKAFTPNCVREKIPHTV
jgi:hypothetical protein